MILEREVRLQHLVGGVLQLASRRLPRVAPARAAEVAEGAVVLLARMYERPAANDVEQVPQESRERFPADALALHPLAAAAARRVVVAGRAPPPAWVHTLEDLLG